MNDIFNIFSPKYYICAGSRAYISSAKWIFDKTINLRLEPGELCAKEKKLISRTQLLVTEEAQESNKFQFLKTVNSLQTAKQNSCLCQLCYNADKKYIFTNENFAFVITIVLLTFTKDPLQKIYCNLFCTCLQRVMFHASLHSCDSCDAEVSVMIRELTHQCLLLITGHGHHHCLHV